MSTQVVGGLGVLQQVDALDLVVLGVVKPMILWRTQPMMKVTTKE